VTQNPGRTELSDQIDAVRIDQIAGFTVRRRKILAAPGRDARV
jgi:hypothetical protein